MRWSLSTATFLLGMCWQVLCQDGITLNKFQRCHHEGTGSSMVLMTCPVKVNSTTTTQFGLKWLHNGSAITEDTHHRAYVSGKHQQELRIASARVSDSGDYYALLPGTGVIVCDIALEVLPSPMGCQATAASGSGTPPLVVLVERARRKTYTTIVGDELCIPLAPSLVQGQYLTAARPYNVTVSVFKDDRLLLDKAPLSNSSKSVCLRHSTVSGDVPTYSSYVTVSTTTGCPGSASCLFLWSAEYSVVTQSRSTIQAVTPNMSVPIGQRITYTCSAYGYHPLLSLHNAVDGTVLVDTATEQARHYNTVSSDGRIFYQIEENSTAVNVTLQGPFSAALLGAIVCAARSLGSADVNDQRLTVIEPIEKPTVVIRKYIETNCNSTVYVCNTYGRPKPAATWQFNGAALPNVTGTQLSLGSTTPHGLYTCLGSNSKGVGHDSIDYNGTACEERNSSPASAVDLLVPIVAPVACVLVLAVLITCYVYSASRRGRQGAQGSDSSKTRQTSVDVSVPQENVSIYQSNDSLDIEAGSNPMDNLSKMTGLPNVRNTMSPQPSLTTSSREDRPVVKGEVIEI